MAALTTLSGARAEAQSVNHARSLLYASAIGCVDVYAADLSDELPIAQITAESGASDASGLAVDADGNVWVTHPGGPNDNQILEYKPGASKPSFTISEPSESPIFVSVARDGTVYVGNLDSTGYSIAEYAHGKTVPFYTVTVPSAGIVGGIASDGNGNLFVAYTVAGPPQFGTVVRYKRGSGVPHALGITLETAGGVAVDPHDMLVVLDRGARSVGVYRLGTKKPLRTIGVNALLGATTSIALDMAGDRLYVAVGGSLFGPSGIYVYDYAAGTQIGDIVAGFPSSYPPPGLAAR